MLVTSILSFSHNVFKSFYQCSFGVRVCVCDRVNPFPKEEILDKTKLKAFAEDKLNKNDISVLDRIGNIVGKGENAGYQHFLLFPCFLKACLSGASKGAIVWQRVNPLPHRYIAVENIVRKKEIACYE